MYLVLMLLVLAEVFLPLFCSESTNMARKLAECFLINLNRNYYVHIHVPFFMQLLFPGKIMDHLQVVVSRMNSDMKLENLFLVKKQLS